MATELSVPAHLRRGALKGDEQQSIESGVRLIELMCEHFGVHDLGSARVLDMGCGVKLTQAFLSRDLPIGEYVGIDVYREMIDFLRANVSDPRFSFHAVNTRNAMYNPDGESLCTDAALPVEPASFDYICLFSVFTHLAPDDFSAMLGQLRHYVKPAGKMLFSLFLNEPSESGLGVVDRVIEMMHPEGVEYTAPSEVPDFIDMVPDEPLKIALYSRNYATALFEGSGWQIESIHEPRNYIAHYMLCTPT